MPASAFARASGFSRASGSGFGLIPAADFEFCTARTELRFASKELLRPQAQPWFHPTGPAPALFFQACLYSFFTHRLSLVAFQCSPIREFRPPSPKFTPAFFSSSLAFFFEIPRFFYFLRIFQFPFFFCQASVLKPFPWSISHFER